MADFETLFAEAKDKIVQLGKNTLGEYATRASGDANDYLETIRNNLQRHTRQLAERKIDAEDFELLINSDIAVGKMKLDTQSGLAKIRVDEFTGAVKGIVLNTLLKAVDTVI